MQVLRHIVKWVGRHRWLTLFVFAVIVAGTAIVRYELDQTQGDLSDPVQKGPIVESVYGIGTVTANRIYQIKPGVVTTIFSLYVKEGDDVKKGASLANVDGVTYKAPFAGTVTSLPYNVGENVFAQLPILTLVDLQDRYIMVSMEQQGALRVKRGQKVKLSFDSLRDLTYEGAVNAIYSFQSSFLARIDVGHLPANILPGMTADVAIEIQSKPDAIVIPVAGVEAGKQVWIKRGNAWPRQVAVQLGIVDKEFAEVVSGDVLPGDRLLIRKKITQ